jgi:SAM-dependent methyltransferase
MTADWTQGYVTETLYTDGFFRELSPAWLNYVAALKGCLPIPLDRPFTYLELGCGLGRSATVFAGAFPQARFIGVDFNPAHIALARRYAETIGVENISFLERGFADLASSELPECDFIVLHGVYTWVNATARAEIRRIIRENLKPGGLVYVSYNSLPGWAAASPLRKLMVEIAADTHGDRAEAVGPALDLMEELNGANFAYLKSNSSTAQTLKTLKARGKNYLAHEFLNSEWKLFYSVDIADEMADAKLTYLGSATLAENHIEYLVDKATAEKINAQRSPRLRQLLLDYAINQRFRRDVFVRGHQRLDGIDREVTLGAIPLGSLVPESQFTAKAKVGNREVTFAEKLFPLIKEAVKDGPRTIAELRRICGAVADRMASVDHLLATLAAAGHLAPFARLSTPEGQHLADVNKSILDLAVATKSRQQLISALAGTGIVVDAVEAILYDAHLAGAKTAKALEKRLLQRLKEVGLSLSKRGQAVKTAEEQQAIAGEIVARFLNEKSSILAQLG